MDATRNVSISVTTTAAQCGTKSNTATVAMTGKTDVVPGNNSAGPVVITINCPDVGVTKVAKAPKINAGQVAQYNIEVTALGTGIHPGVTLTDVLPGGSAKGWTVSGADAAACDEDPNTAGIQIVGNDLNCNFGDINPAVDATRNVSISVTTTAAQCGTKSNTATVAMTGKTDVVPGNNSAGPVIITINCPDVGVTKVAKAPKINAGQVAQYNIEVTALGTGIHPGVTLTDVLPGGGAKGWTVTGTDAAACDEDPNTAGVQIVGNDLNCNFGDINPAVDATRNVSISVTTTAAQCGTKSNTATVAMTGKTDVVPGNNSAGPVIITINCPDVGVTKVAKAPKINAGQVAQYNIEVTALGTGIHPGVTLTDVLPGGGAKGWTVSWRRRGGLRRGPEHSGHPDRGERPELQLRGHQPGRGCHAQREHLGDDHRRAVRHQVEHGDGGDDGQDGCRPG